MKERAYESILPKEEKMTIEVAIEVEEEVVTGAEVEDVEAKEVVAVDEVDSTVLHFNLNQHWLPIFLFLKYRLFHLSS